MTVIDEVTVVDDGKLDCGRFMPRKDGTIRAHKCIETATGEEVTTVAQTPHTRVTRKGKGKKHAPENVRRFGVAILASGVEWGATQTVSRAVPMPVSDVPEEVIGLPDADAMIGPILDGLWPQLPPGVQKAIGALADQEELIAALFGWIAYTKAVRSYIESEQDRREDKTSGTPTVPIYGAAPRATVFGPVYDTVEPDTHSV